MPGVRVVGWLDGLWGHCTFINRCFRLLLTGYPLKSASAVRMTLYEHFYYCIVLLLSSTFLATSYSMLSIDMRVLDYVYTGSDQLWYGSTLSTRDRFQTGTVQFHMRSPS